MGSLLACPLGAQDFLVLGEDNRRGQSSQGPKGNVAPGNDSQATKYRNLWEQRLAALKAILWDEEKGAWFDYDLENGKKNQEFYPSNLAPLWAGCFSDPGVVDKALKYLEVRGQLAGWYTRRRTTCSLPDSEQ